MHNKGFLSADVAAVCIAQNYYLSFKLHADLVWIINFFINIQNCIPNRTQQLP